jgi:hypothetical protein
MLCQRRCKLLGLFNASDIWISEFGALVHELEEEEGNTGKELGYIPVPIFPQ